MKKILQELLNISRKGDAKVFMQVAEKKKVLDPSNLWSPDEISRLVFCYSILRIKEKKSWASLENLYLDKAKEMNPENLISCAHGFSKFSNNKLVWTKIQESFHQNYPYFDTSNAIATLCYSFANANINSNELWTKLEYKAIHYMNKSTEKDLSLYSWSFQKLGLGSSTLWKCLDQNLIGKMPNFQLRNLAIISYSFSKIKYSNETFWRVLERSIDYRISKTKDLSPRDIANIAWAFANKKMGSDILWERLEKIIVMDSEKYSLMDLTNSAWSFLISNRNNPDFWRNFENRLMKINYINEKWNQDLIMIGEILTRKDIKNEDLWKKLTENFEIFLRKGIFNNSMFRARWHRNFFDKKPQMWNEEVEKIYLRSIPTDKIVFNLYNVMLLTYPKYGSKNFWRSFIQIFGKTLEKDEVLIQNEAFINMTLNLIYVFTSVALRENKESPDMLTFLQSKLDEFFERERVLEKFILKNSDLMLAVKAFVLQKNTVHQRSFWKGLIKIRQQQQEIFNEKNIISLIYAIIVKNGLYFQAEKSFEFEDEIRKIEEAMTAEEKIKSVTILADLLLKYSSNHEEIIKSLNQNFFSFNLDIGNYLKKVDLNGGEFQQINNFIPEIFEDILEENLQTNNDDEESETKKI